MGQATTSTPSRFGRPLMNGAGVLLLLLLLRPVFETPFLLFAEPGAYVPDPGMHEWRISAALIMWGLAAAGYLLGYGARVPRLAAGAMGVWVLLAAFSVLWTVDRGQTVRQGFELAALASVWWTAAQLGGDVRWRRAGVVVLLAGLGAMCAVGLYQYFYLLERIRVEAFARMTEWIGLVAADRLYSNRIYATFVSPSVFGDYLAVLLPLSLGCAAARRTARRRGPALLATLAVTMLAAAAAWCLVLTTARGAWLAAAVAVGLLLFGQAVRRVIGPRSGAATVLLVAALLVVPTHAQNPAPEPAASQPVDFAGGMADGYFEGELPGVQDLLSTRTLGMRATYWRSTLVMVRDRPLGGIGWGAWGAAYPRFTVRGGWPTQLAHNNYLQVWAELGLAGLLSFVLLLGTALWSGVRHARMAPTSAARWMWGGATCGALAFAVHSLTDYALYMPAVSWPLFAMLGALHSAPAPETAPRTAPRTPQAVLVLLVALGALALWQRAAAGARGVREARALRAGGRLELARDVAVEAMEAAPWDGEAAALAGRLIAETAPRATGPGWQAALDALARAVAQQPLSPWARESYAEVLWQVGLARRDRALLEESVRQRQAAVERYPVHPDLHARLAEAARAVGDVALARRHAALADELRPDYHGAMERE